jgi:hypothetical protein
MPWCVVRCVWRTTFVGTKKKTYMRKTPNETRQQIVSVSDLSKYLLNFLHSLKVIAAAHVTVNVHILGI